MKIISGKEAEYESYKSKNPDPYGKCVVDYSEKWADLMEQRIERGAKLADIAQDTSHEADTDGITGFMYGCAVQGLAHFWIHGDELRQWHNASYGVAEEKAKGGTVNPAILTVG